MWKNNKDRVMTGEPAGEVRGQVTVSLCFREKQEKARDIRKNVKDAIVVRTCVT